MIPQDLHYGFFSAYIFLFVVLMLGAQFWFLYHYRKKALYMYSSNENLKKLLTERSKIIYFFKAILFCLSWILITYALMQPQGNGYYPNIAETKKKDNLKEAFKLKAHDVIFLIDASASMSVHDTISGKSRLEFAKEIADEIASSLKGENAALYAFTSTATKMSPPTPDLFFVRMMLRQLSINEGGVTGTDFLKSLEKIREKHKDAYRSWTTQLDDELTVMYSENVKVPEMAKYFGRTRGAINSRIKKLKLV